MSIATLLLAAASSVTTPALTDPPPSQSAVSPALRRVRISGPDAFRLADLWLQQGRQKEAIAAFRTLTSDPDRNLRAEARFRLARLLAGEGKLSEAATLLRQVLDDKPDAGPARLALAQLLTSIGDEEGARRELRAVQAGKLPLDVARMVDRFSEALRVRKPFGGSFELAMAPDSNINRATRSDTVGTVIGPFDISNDGKATSGIGLAARGQVYRRFDLGDRASLLGRLSVSADLYGKSDYNDLALDAAVGPELRLGGNLVRAEAGVTRRWFGGDPFVDSARVAASVTRPLGSRTQVRLAGSASLIDNKLNDLQDGKGYGASISVERALSPTTGVGLTLSGDRQSLKDPAYSTRSWRASLVGWREVGRSTLTASIDYGQLEADERLMLFPERRSETFTRLSIGSTFRQFTVRGFAPLVRFSVERNKSSIEIYDYSRRRTEVGVTRAF